jgi:hypothetical protein
MIEGKGRKASYSTILNFELAMFTGDFKGEKTSLEINRSYVWP